MESSRLSERTSSSTHPSVGVSAAEVGLRQPEFRVLVPDEGEADGQQNRLGHRAAWIDMQEHSRLRRACRFGQ